MLKCILAAAGLFVLSSGAFAADLEIVHPRIRAMLPNQPVAAGYMDIHNGGAEADKLLSAASADAGSVELHKATMEGDVMKMRPVEGGVAIPAGGMANFEPGGLHMMLIDPVRTFADGESVPVTLTFERAGEVEVDFPVMRDVTAAGPQPTQHDHGAMMDMHGADGDAMPSGK